MSKKAVALRSTSLLLFVTGGVLLVVGAWVSLHQHQANNVAKKQSESVATSQAPSTVEVKETAFEAYTVPSDQPRYLFIPDISVRAIVKPLSLAADGHIAAPSNVFYTGWYTGSSKSGTPGAMLIDGHVSSWDARGIFYDLQKLHAGQIITVQRGDNAMLHYTVVKVQTYDDDQVDMAAVLSPVNPRKPGLNLITCFGSVKKGTNEFNKRLVVFAEQQ